MIAYFDTSAIVPLLIDEPGSKPAGELWNNASRIIGISLLYAEARSALAQAQRVGRLKMPELRVAVDILEELYLQLDLVEIDNMLARQAGELAEIHGLRGYDAVHLAAAIRVIDPDLVMVSGDQALIASAKSVGLAVASTN